MRVFNGEEDEIDVLVKMLKDAGKCIMDGIPGSQFAKYLGDIQNLMGLSMSLANPETKDRIIERLNEASNIEANEIRQLVDHIENYTNGALSDKPITQEAQEFCKQYIQKLDTSSLQEDSDSDSDSDLNTANSNVIEQEGQILFSGDIQAPDIPHN